MILRAFIVMAMNVQLQDNVIVTFVLMRYVWNFQHLVMTIYIPFIVMITIVHQTKIVIHTFVQMKVSVKATLGLVLMIQEDFIVMVIIVHLTKIAIPISAKANLIAQISQRVATIGQKNTIVMVTNVRQTRTVSPTSVQ